MRLLRSSPRAGATMTSLGTEDYPTEPCSPQPQFRIAKATRCSRYPLEVSPTLYPSQIRNLVAHIIGYHAAGFFIPARANAGPVRKPTRRHRKSQTGIMVLSKIDPYSGFCEPITNELFESLLSFALFKCLELNLHVPSFFAIIVTKSSAFSTSN
jgi:hypothetical protein